MLNVRQILVSAASLVACGVALSGCGQTGALYLPTDPAAAHRASLPDSLMPSMGKDAPKTGEAPVKSTQPAQQPASGVAP